MRSDDWSTSDIASLPVVGGKQQTLPSGLPNDPDSLIGWYGVDRQHLVDPWVLVQRWGVDLGTDAEPAPARLLNVSSGEVIELAPGTFGWR